MTEQRANANREDLYKYMQDCQDMATDLSGLVESAAVLDSDGSYANGVTTLLKVAAEIANQLTDKMDSVNLPKVQS